MSDTVPSSEDLLAAWREAETQQERDEILADMEVDEIEAGWMATNGMPFPGETTGGGRGVHLKVKLSDCQNAELVAEFNAVEKKQKEISNAKRSTLTAKECYKWEFAFCALGLLALAFPGGPTDLYLGPF